MLQDPASWQLLKVREQDEEPALLLGVVVRASLIIHLVRRCGDLPNGGPHNLCVVRFIAGAIEEGIGLLATLKLGVDHLEAFCAD
jgi:hypothetical protein